MPHVLWELQGERDAEVRDAEGSARAHGKTVHKFTGFEAGHAGHDVRRIEYDQAVADLVGYLQWMAEPAQNDPQALGVWVLLFLALFTVLAWRLNAAYWKDVK